jgi:hypothetical protein
MLIQDVICHINLSPCLSFPTFQEHTSLDFLPGLILILGFYYLRNERDGRRGKKQEEKGEGEEKDEEEEKEEERTGEQEENETRGRKRRGRRMGNWRGKGVVEEEFT